MDPLAAETPALHMIGNAHLDPVWLWRWPEGCAEAIGTCWAAVDLLDQWPGFIFTRGEAVVYRWIERLEPALFRRIEGLVREGRWAIVNGWWLQPDCNLPDGECLIRQALLGVRYFRERFGVEVSIAYNVDSFGHAATLPMLLRHTGFAGYVFMRPRAHEKALPGWLFDWEAPDGSRIPAYRIPVAYQTARTAPPRAHLDRLSRYDALAEHALEGRLLYLEEQARESGHPLMFFYGVGNHGGGPTRADLAVIRDAQRDGHTLIFSDPARYFAAIADTPRPTVRDELQHHAIGCYSAVSEIKALNRRAESRLAQAEAACALAMRHAGGAYPRAALARLWETLLFNQFHDILCGTSIESAMRDAAQALSGVIQGAEELLNDGVRRLAAGVAPAGESTDTTLLIFNLTGEPAAATLETEPWLSDDLARTPRRLLDSAGREVPYQTLAPEAYAGGLTRIAFTPRVPAFGYHLYRMAPGEPTPVASTLRVALTLLESARWRLEIDPATGAIARLVDRATGRPVFSDSAHAAAIVDDPSDTWAHGLDRFGLEGARFACEHIEIVEYGPLRAAIRTRAHGGASTITSTYLLCDDPEAPIEIRVLVDWHERNRLLRLRYPLAMDSPTFRYEVPYGSQTRPADGREWPGQRWMLASDDRGGVAIAGDTVYSYAAAEGAVYLTPLRSPAYAHHDPHALQPDGAYRFTDQGERAFTLRLAAGPAVGPREAFRLAQELARPPIATPHVARGGTRPHRASLLAVEAHSVVAPWLKAAEDSDSLVLRLLELEGRPDAAAIVPGASTHELRGYGLATLREDGPGEWRPCDGLERRPED